jgi:hypothetical protein
MSCRWWVVVVRVWMSRDEGRGRGEKKERG